MRNGEKVWYCKRTSENGSRVETFAKPVEVTLRFGDLTIQPSSGYDSIMEFGEKVRKMWNCIAQPYEKWINVVSEGDRWYVDGVKPNIPTDGSEPEDGWGFDANARVYSTRPQNLALRFILQKIE